MDIIDFQSKACPKRGRIEYYWFENEHINLPRTLFHRVVIPFEPFDTGLVYVSQPEETELCYEWLVLGLDDQSALSGLNLRSADYEQAEASIYVGAAHNPVVFERFSLQNDGDVTFKINAEMRILFEFEGVAKNENVAVSAEALYVGEV